LVEAVLQAAAEALEIGVHDEVDDAGHSIGTVDRRRAAGEDVDPLDECGRDGVEVGPVRGAELPRVAIPEAPLAMVEFCEEKTCGRLTTRSSILFTPE
jgi:hypothetical protein